MSELESSGLLDKEPEHAGPPNDPSRAPTQDPTPRTSILSDTHTPDGSASPSTGVDPAGQEAAESNLAATIVNAVTDDQAEVPKQGDAPEQHAADASGAVAASSEAAEQRVLGDLEGAPTWREVRMPLMPMLSYGRQGRYKKRQLGNFVLRSSGSFSMCTQASLCLCMPTADASVCGLAYFHLVCARPIV